MPDNFSIGLREPNYVDFRYHLIKLKNLDFRKFLDSDNPLAFALMAKMNYNRRQRVRLKADFLRLILGADIDRARESILVDFIETYMHLDTREQTQYEEIVVKEPEYQEVSKMITVYEKRGMKEGRKEGKQSDLILLLEEKFGELEPAMKRKVRQISSAKRLESLLVAVLNAETVEDMDL